MSETIGSYTERRREMMRASGKSQASTEQGAQHAAEQPVNSIAEDAGEAGRLVSGVPQWENRELTKEYTGEAVKRGRVDMPFLLLTLLILMIGLIMLFSASFVRGYYSGDPMKVFIRQLVFAISGLAIMVIGSIVRTKFISRWSYMLLFISIIFLVAVIFVGTKVNGARRWLGVEGGGMASFSFQPSEIAKLALILAFAKWTCDKGQAGMKTFRFGVLPYILVTGIMVLLLMREPHISASIILLVLAVIMMFAGGTRLVWFTPVLVALIAVVWVVGVVSAGSPEQESDSQNISDQLSQIQWAAGRFGYADGRIDAWLNPEADPLDGGFQIRQSLYAVGSGGLLGQGLGQSRQKYLYLPEEHNDYIFAVICEELGYIGAVLILMLFALLIIRGYWLALHAKSRYGALITTGITSLLAIQVFLNVAVVTNLLPATGISLPFFSSGGTALWIQLFQVGLVLSVSREIPQDREGGRQAKVRQGVLPQDGARLETVRQKELRNDGPRQDSAWNDGSRQDSAWNDGSRKEGVRP
ncbi:MAG: putative lipid II flippase FtsW [Oscillospiraceae bacterium]|nr:putative lipid II flippase FtsW [Oscillospiraceae bacterium]